LLKLRILGTPIKKGSSSEYDNNGPFPIFWKFTPLSVLSAKPIAILKGVD